MKFGKFTDISKGADKWKHFFIFADSKTIECDTLVEFSEHYGEWSVSEGEEGRSLPELVLWAHNDHVQNIQHLWQDVDAEERHEAEQVRT